MRRQISGKPDGSNPLIYTGSVPNMVTMPRRPTVQDGLNWQLGYWWVIPKDDTFTTGEVWILVSVANAIATWKKLHGGGGPTPPTNTLLINKIYLTTPGAGTYTPTAGMVQCYVECVGGGGGGFGSGGASSGTSGGSAGGYCAKLFTAVEIGTSKAYSVGAGGAGGAHGGNAGSAGGDTTFGGVLTANGGGAGTGYGTINPGGSATGGDINIQGGTGTVGAGFETDLGVFQRISGNGGSSMYGQGGSGVWLGNGSFGAIGNSGSGYGSGPAGNFGDNGGVNIGGADGQSGIIIITEYLA